MNGLICSICDNEFIWDDIMSSDVPMCEKFAEEEWQQLIIKDNAPNIAQREEWWNTKGSVQDIVLTLD